MLTRSITAWLTAERLAKLAERVASRSRLAVWQRVMHRLPALGVIEARGYLRARATTIIREETDRLVEQEGAIAAAYREEIAAAATAQLVETILSTSQQRAASQGRFAA
jgi:hypothetical protein